MLLAEAKEILKKNGYKLVEVYDAVTDRNNFKNSRTNVDSYFTNVIKRVQMTLAKEGVKSKLVDDGDGLRIGHFGVMIDYNKEDREADRGRSEEGWAGDDDEEFTHPTGPESGKFAGFKKIEQEVTLKMYSGLKHVDTADFDVRNTPGIVQWILDYIE